MKYLAPVAARLAGFQYPPGPQSAVAFRQFDNVAGYGANTSPTTGAIVFEIPVGFANHMQVHEFVGFSYTSNGGGWRARVAFYSRASVLGVAAPSVTYDTAGANAEAHPQVRIGRRIATGNPVIIFGDVTSVWAYPKIQLASSFVGYSATADNMLEEAPAPALVATDLTAYDLVVSPFDNSIINGSADASTAFTTGTLPVARGGTGGTATPTAGGNAYGTGTALAYTAAGTAKQAMVSNGAAAPSWATLDLTYLPDSWVKKAVKAATTANITLSAPQTIDGISCVAGDRVLVKNQTTSAQNGIYDVAAGAWVRSAGSNASTEIAGGTVSVDQGTTQSGSLWRTPFKPTDTLGTTAMYWALMRPSLTGTASVPIVAALATATAIAITFPVGQFAAAPKMAFSSDSSRLTIGFSAVTTTGCNILCSNWSNASSTAATVHWTATA